MSEYDPIQLTADAVKFANSRFGRHYLARLKAAKTRYLADAMNDTLTDSARAHAGTKAATVALEIDYFTTAKTVQDDSNLLKRMSDNFRRRTTKPKEL